MHHDKELKICDKICQIMALILKVKSVKRNQSFLDAGGHSIKVMALKNQLESYFNVELNFSDVMMHNSPEELAEFIGNLPKGGRSGTVKCEVISGDTKTKIPANEAQKLLYFATMSHVEARAYNVPVLLQLSKKISVGNIRASFQSSCLRHPALTSGFVVEGGELFQKFDVVSKIPFVISHISKESLQKEIFEFAQPFSLDKGPLVRACLFDDGGKHHHLLIDFHHLVMDGLSLEVFLSDFLAYLKGEECNAPFDYKVAAASLNSLNKIDPRWKLAQNYWSDFLKKPLRSPKFPGKTVKVSGKAGGRGKSLRVNLEEDLVKGVEEFCRSHEATLHSFFLAVLNNLISKITHEDEVLIGVPSNGRATRETEGVVGLFARTLPSRHQIKTTDRFSDFVKEVNAHCLKRMDYELYPLQGEIPFEVEHSSFNYSVAYTTQQFNFDLGNAGRILRINYPFCHFPLLFSVIEYLERGARQFELSVEYDSEQFDDKTINIYAKSFVNLCDQIVASHGSKSINSLSLLPDDVSLDLVARFNPGGIDGSENNGTVISRFKEMAAAFPERVALVSLDEKLSYRTLDELTDRIAIVLRSRLSQEGPARGSSIAVLATRNVDYVVAILAILKAGVAYVPLDQDYPVVRLQMMVETAQCCLCLDLGGNANSLAIPILDWAQVLAAADSQVGIQRSNEIGVDADTRAYVMFTSGSTGTPKGVGISHRNILRLVQPNNPIPLSEDTKVLLTGSPSFDATTYEIWAPLLHGGSVAFIDKMTLLDSRKLSHSIDRFTPNTMWMTAPLFFRMIREKPDLFEAVDYLIVGGDVVSPDAVAMAQESSPGLTVVNGYGPTENTTFSTFYVIPRGINQSAISIGRPLLGSTAYVMDKGGNILPPNALGELYVGGDGVSEGYINDDISLTAEKFVNHRWPNGKKKYLYRTGDLAYWDQDGLIHLLGRIDSQVKTRGFRVELEEVRSHLLRQPEIQDAYVTLTQEEQGGDSLAAYLVLESSVPEEVLASLHTTLRNALPGYMVPTRYLQVEALPLNINGKIAKNQLPQGLRPWPVGGSMQMQNQLTGSLARPERPPQQLEDPETAIQRIWSEILGVGVPGLDESFFSLGGDSLKVITLASRLEGLYGARPSIVNLYSLNTVRKQRDYFEADAQGKVAANANNASTGVGRAITPMPKQKRVKANDAQTRIYILDQVTAGRAPYLIPLLFKLNGKLSIERLREAWAALRERHLFLQSRFEMDADQIVWVESSGEEPSNNFKASTGIHEADLPEWLEAHLGSYNFTQSGVARLDVVETVDDNGPGAVYLAFIFHHIAVDGTSIDIITRDLSALYRGEVLDPIETSAFQFWARRERNENSDKANIYWRNRLSQSTTEIQLPNDFSRSAHPQIKGETLHRTLSEKILADVNEVALKNDATPYMVYLTAFVILLRRYSRQSDFNLGTVASGRMEPEASQLVGMLATTLPIRIQLNPDWTFVKLLEFLKIEILNGLDHQDFSFKELVAELNSSRESWRNPLFNVFFSMIASGSVPPFGSGVSLKKIDWNYQGAKFDLSLFVTDDPENPRISIEFASDIFKRSTAERVACNYLNILKNILINSNQSIDNISILSQMEREDVLNGFNATSTPYDRKCLIHQLFERQVVISPNSIAVEQEGASYTYLELENSANQLAASLRRIGVNKGIPVLVMMDRSAGMIISVLAVLKAGGFYVPVETDIPEQRLMSILEELQISHFITDKESLSNFKINNPKFEALKKIVYVESDKKFTNENADCLTPVATSEDLAYVIFTSGSTGTPKGVKVAHRPVINLIEWVNGRYQVNGGDKLLFITSLCFDLSVYDIFGILAAGGTIRVAHKSEVLDAQRLAKIVLDEKITFWDSAPGAMQQILQFIPVSDTPSHALRLVFLSGDWVPVSIPGELRKLFPEVRVVALGGATEATVWSNYFDVTEDSSNWVSIPYGKPIQNARYYVLDDLNQPCPIGIPGKIFIGGECLAEGYTGIEKLTEERFIADPFDRSTDELNGPVDHQRIMYDTGDLGSWRQDGTMIFLGRADHQVKIRGYRVELGEIALSLKQHPAIREVIALAQLDPTGQKVLVAYVTTRSQINSQELSDFLAAKLPAYMIPAWYSFLDEFPVTRNGKFDLKRLPNVSELISLQNEETAEERRVDSLELEELERQIECLWCQILGREVTSRNLSFHRAGGNSLLLVRLHRGIDERWPGAFSIPDLFVIATISDQAKHVAFTGAEKVNDVGGNGDKDSNIDRILDELQTQGITVEQAFEQIRTAYRD
ncbi:amino acid adenylation domain-containing protein [Pandoraea sp. NPDC087047]|uniref:amino acid adenylation domain-containing protein n=1 Tax=Pandoraea sp. NPDC087047 TaxID=3364390 RepID=UPI0038002983